MLLTYHQDLFESRRTCDIKWTKELAHDVLMDMLDLWNEDRSSDLEGLVERVKKAIVWGEEGEYTLTDLEVEEVCLSVRFEELCRREDYVW